MEMPADIERNKRKAALWSQLAPEGCKLTDQDAPTLRLLVFWHLVAEAAQKAISKGGTLAIFDPVALKPFRDAEGDPEVMVRKAPALSVLKEASSEIRALSDALGVTPSARSRIGADDGRRAESEHGALLASVLADSAGGGR